MRWKVEISDLLSTFTRERRLILSLPDDENDCCECRFCLSALQSLLSDYIGSMLRCQFGEHQVADRDEKEKDVPNFVGL
jgi:hypothetical protein